MWVKAAVVVDREGDKLTVWTSDPITEGSEQPRTFGRGYITELTADEFVKLGARPKEEVVEGRGTSEEGREAEASENEEERSVGSTDGTQIFTQEEAISFIAQMEGRAKVAPELELTIENWDAQFGEDGRVITPIGVVKMGENQFTKLMRQGRNGKLGMIKPTLEEPDIIIEDSSKAKDGDIAERNSSYVFVKAFKKADGSRYYYFTSITVSKDGLEVVVSNQEKSHNRILRLMTEGKVLWRTPKNATTASVEQQGLDYVQPTKTETATKDSGVTPQSTDMSPSIDKGSGKLESSQREGVKEAETQVESENQHYDGEVTVAGTTDKDGITTFLFSLYRRSRKDGKVKRVSLGGIEAKSENFILDPEDDGFDEFLATTTSKIRVKKIRTNGERYFADIAVLGEGHYDGVEMKPEAAQRLIQKAEDGADAMPMREVEYGDGEVGKEPDFSQVTPERTARYLDNESGMDSTDVDKFVDNMIAKATKAAEE
ncbi:MAG: PBECR2 nuclease fold domain-containing protein, partial [Candidatus Limisoma sp.]